MMTFFFLIQLGIIPNYEMQCEQPLIWVKWVPGPGWRGLVVVCVLCLAGDQTITNPVPYCHDRWTRIFLFLKFLNNRVTVNESDIFGKNPHHACEIWQYKVFCLKIYSYGRIIIGDTGVMYHHG